MKLQEYQAKALFRQAGIPIPASMLASDAEQVKRAASEIGFPVVLKAQTLESGRGKAGGVRIVNKDNDVENISNEVFKLEINEQPVHIILVEKAFTFLKEYYLGIYTDLDGGCRFCASQKAAARPIWNRTHLTPKLSTKNRHKRWAAPVSNPSAFDTNRYLTDFMETV